MNKKVLVAVATVAFLVSGCGYIIREIASPNKCEKCEVVDTTTGEVLSTYEGCGGSRTNVERDAELAAYSCMKATCNCNIDVVCTTWTEDEEED